MFVALLLSACGGQATSNVTPGPSGAPSNPSDAESTTVDGPVVRYAQRSPDQAGMAAKVGGRLQLDGVCLYIVGEQGRERYPVLWPAGTAWDAQNTSVISPTGEPMPVGTAVEGAGGYLSVADVERLAGREASSLAARCVANADGEIVVVNNSDSAIGPTR